MYSAHHRFTAANGEAWQAYIQWSGRTQAREIITVDGLLCAPVIDALTTADWDHNIHADNRVYFFTDYAYLRDRIQFDPAKHNILELTQEPEQHVSPTQQFDFCGYDIVDADNSISVLLNCGSFPDIFAPTETNQFGLLDTLDRAQAIAAQIRRANPGEPHCQNCRVWGISRYVPVDGCVGPP
ncbi:PDDEXK family nuclease [Leptothoe kymatousa]|uniref:Uncharacterized protein n=1 Tax=Leptothoe kymatousa TAU-MAC 1615 TaxID=2364775 RepID=A0ABS5Y5Z8_9CYAN|nr:hypothetical protein [Leptothoe kymatousa]MBT9313232.1 hypothetical protein [Leptothoe kymatousa TAU-MAC 1615]